VEGSVLGRCLPFDSGYCEGIEVMKVQMRCNYGSLQGGEEYEYQERGCDWYMVQGIFVPDCFVRPMAEEEPTWDYARERWNNLPVTRDEEYESYAQYINREMPPVARW